MPKFDELLKKFEDTEKEFQPEEDKPLILVIDDNESIRRGLTRALSYKYIVKTADTGAKGIDQLDKSIHCVILDVKMKELNGFSTYPKVKSKCPDVPIIFFTAFQSEHDLQEVINKYKPEGYVEKGRDISFLVNLIENAVKKYKLVLENEEYKENLEKKVEKRTVDLELALDKLKETQVQLVQAAKMASIGTLSAGIAHEINNPAVAFKRGTDHLKDAVTKYLYLYEIVNDILKEKPTITFFNKICDAAFKNGIEGKKMSTIEVREKAKEFDSLLASIDIDDQRTISKTICQVGLIFEDIKILIESEARNNFLDLINFIKNLYDIGSIIHMMNISSERIIKITESMRRYSHLDQQPESEVDIQQGIEDTLIILQNELKENIEIEKSFKKIQPITCYPAELVQVWTNIIYNAIQAMDGKGKLIIKTFEKDEFVCVSISDSGPGIPIEIQDKIFDPFFTTKDQGEGSGLGLSICHKIIEKHNGKISIRSKSGETVFEVFLPKQPKKYN